MSWTVEFFEDEDGRAPAREFILGLSSHKRAAVIAAIEAVLTPRGLDVCDTEYGKALGDGLYEFRLRHDEKTIRDKVGGASDGATTGVVLLRVFFAVHGERIVLLLSGYDKGRDASSRRQEREIQKARKLLRSFGLRRARERAAQRRRT